MSSLFVCPLCGGALTRREGSYLCPAGHCFDIAREGYTYLLPVNRKHSKTPGDDKAMAAARHAFLEKGYYAPLCEELCQLAVELTGDAPAVLDNGCGEGYYTAGIYRALCDAGKTPVMAGIDISKPILRLAAKREKNVQFAVASSYRLPAADGSVDLLINCFSPLAIEEFRRVLLDNILAQQPGEEYVFTEEDKSQIARLREQRYATWEWNYGQSRECEMTRQKRFPACGGVEAHLSTDRGVIRHIAFTGDFFSVVEPEVLAEKLVGVRLEEQSLRDALAQEDAGRYFSGLKNEELIELLLS